MKNLPAKILKRLVNKALSDFEEDLLNENGHVRKFLQNLIKFCKKQLQNF